MHTWVCTCMCAGPTTHPGMSPKPPVLAVRDPPPPPPLVREYHPIVREYHPIVREYHPIVREYHPIVREYHPIVREYHPIVREYHPIVREYHPIVREYHPIIRDHPSLVVSTVPIVRRRKPLISRVCGHSPPAPTTERTICNDHHIDGHHTMTILWVGSVRPMMGGGVPAHVHGRAWMNVWFVECVRLCECKPVPTICAACQSSQHIQPLGTVHLGCIGMVHGHVLSIASAPVCACVCVREREMREREREGEREM